MKTIIEQVDWKMEKFAIYCLTCKSGGSNIILQILFPPPRLTIYCRDCNIKKTIEAPKTFKELENGD